jgi:signal transduction histidine kinase
VEVGGKRFLTVSMRDVSEQKRVEDEERLLAEIGKILVSAGPDYQRLLTDVADILVRNIADWCTVDILQLGGAERLRVVHRDPAMGATFDALARYSARGDRPGSVKRVLDTRRPVLMSDVSPAYLESIAQDSEHLRLMRALEPGSFIVVPLLARGQILGTLSVGVSRASRRYGPEDLQAVERLADRVALAVDNARAHEALERAVVARDDVLAIVAHDLRAPLSSIVLYSQTLRRRPTEAERRNQKSLEGIQRAATRMNGLIQDLLDVARLEAGEPLPITQGAASASSLLAEAIEHQQGEISRSDRELIVGAARVPQRMGRSNAAASGPRQPFRQCHQVLSQANHGRGPPQRWRSTFLGLE